MNKTSMRIIWAALLGLAIGVCWITVSCDSSKPETEDPEDPKCNDNEERCDDDMIQRCAEGQWIDWKDCTRIDQDCVEVIITDTDTATEDIFAGIECQVGSGGDADGDADGDSDSDADTD